MSTFISHLHDHLRHSHAGATHPAKDVAIGEHKRYERMERINLPQPIRLAASLSDVLARRASSNKGSADKDIPLAVWGTLLGLALGKRADPKSRNYPSGGALYPIETYILGNVIADSAAAAFHYNPTEHALEKLWDMPSDFDFQNLAHTKPDGLLFSALMVFTSVWNRSSAKYGDFTYTLALLEAGHMSENVLLAGTALGLQMRPLAGFKDDAILELLDVDKENEQPVHSITISF